MLHAGEYVQQALRNVLRHILVVSVLAGCTGGGGGDGAPPAPQTSLVTGSLIFQWDAVSAPDLEGYRIYRSTTSGAYGSPIATLPPSSTSYQMTNLTKGVTYFFVVSAFDVNGNESLFSAELSQTIQ